MNLKNQGKKSVLVISSHVVRGTVGNRAVAFALEALGHPVWILPTITLPWHPGHGLATRLQPDKEDFSALCKDIAKARWRDEIAGIITGYMASENQVAQIAGLVGKLKQQNPDLVYLCDPVIGDFVRETAVPAYQDEGRLYVPQTTAAAIRDQLLPLADIATPNLFELGWLSGRISCADQKDMLSAARQLKIDNVLVTSIPALMKDAMGTVLVGSGGAIMSEHKALPDPPNGLGDLTSALFMSHTLSGREAGMILEKTCASVFEILATTARLGADELALERSLASLSRPMAQVNMRKLIG